MKHFYIKLAFLITLLCILCSCNSFNSSDDLLYSFTWEDCDEKGVEPELMEKYRTRQPYDIQTTETDSSVIVSYKFINDCCSRFEGDYAIRQNTLNFTAEILAKRFAIAAVNMLSAMK